MRVGQGGASSIRSTEAHLLDHGKNFHRLHVEHLRDAPLHDEEVWIVHVELDRVEEVLHSTLLSVDAVDEVLVLASNHHLSVCMCVHGRMRGS